MKPDRVPAYINVMIFPLFFFFENLTTALHIIIEVIITRKIHMQIPPSLMNKQQTQILRVPYVFVLTFLSCFI